MPIPVSDVSAIIAASVPIPELEAELVPSDIPLALFPVRLETRFFAVANGMSELRVRIYPDKVHLDSHDPRLSADEMAWGRRFWELEWAAGDVVERRRDAWRMLAGRFGPERAAWIARALTPANPGDRPVAPVDGPLARAPAFPDLGPPATTARTAMVRLLPTRWIATAYLGRAATAVVQGREIVPDLAIGPDLDAPLASDDGDESPDIDEGMLWTVDFDRAEEVGMALRLPLSVPLPAARVDVLLVTGVRGGDGAAALTDQFDAHRYTDGLAFLRPGTPTNNTAAARSAWQTPDPRQEASWAAAWGGEPVERGSAADRAARGFGIDALARLPGGDDTDEGVERAMTVALWPATWGYFLSQMIGFEGGFTVAARQRVREHAVNHLRPGGPLPAMRIGRQPYGVLPVTSLDAWRPRPGDEGTGRLSPILASLRNNVWRAGARGLPRIGRTDNPSDDLVDVLRSGPVSTAYSARNLMGRHFLQHLRAFLGEDLDALGFWTRLVQLTGTTRAQVGLGFVPPIAEAAYDGLVRDVTVPPVGEPGYIGDLLAATDLDALVKPVPRDPVPLLHALLRHALLREHAEAAARLLDSAGTPAATLLRDAELVDMLPGQLPAATWSRQRDREIDGVTVRDRLATGTEPGLAEIRQALATLAATDAATLERHLGSVLDAASHRLDAWITSLATRRLEELRSASPKGVVVGGYGWVESLRPAPQPAAAAPPPDELGPLLTSPDDPGFIHAPSLNQASAAALLRNAHLSQGGTAESPYAIDLSSARVRLAKRLFEGVRQGQPLGALLGYDFERGLIEAGIPEFVDAFRRLAPLPGAETPTGVRRLVVDGLVLSRLWRTDPGTVLVPLRLSSRDPRRIKVLRALDSLEAALDAAADAVNAEGAFQMVRGNLPRAAASLDAISGGETPPPDLGFVATPRTGTPVTHRVVMLFPAVGAPSPAGWAETSPRARADPVLAAWAGRLLGPATDVTARVEVLDAAGSTIATHEVALASLGLTPIDFVWATGGVDGQPPEIAHRLLRAAVVAPGGPAGTASLRADLSRRAGEERGFSDLVEIATRAHRLLAGARPLDGADLQEARAEPARGLDLAEYEARVSAAEAALAEAHQALSDALLAGTDPRPAMLAAAAFGVAEAVPAPSGPGVDADAVLLPQARAVLSEIARRLVPRDVPPPTDDEGRRNRLLERMRAVYGPGFLALPRFVAGNAAELASSRADSAALLGDDPLAPDTWLIRMERVREPLARMARPLREAEALGTAEALHLSVAQVPHVAGRRWLGLAASDETSGTVSLILQGAPGDLAQPLAGLLVDEWTEIVPGRTETTGIAFQYDPPDAAAPQAILLAVPPVIGAPWTAATLNRVLLETMELARLRLVGPEDLGDAGHYLPAAYLAFNAEGDTVSTDLNPLAP